MKLNTLPEMCPNDIIFWNLYSKVLWLLFLEYKCSHVQNYSKLTGLISKLKICTLKNLLHIKIFLNSEYRYDNSVCKFWRIENDVRFKFYGEKFYECVKVRSSIWTLINSLIITILIIFYWLCVIKVNFFNKTNNWSLQK